MRGAIPMTKIHVEGIDSKTFSEAVQNREFKAGTLFILRMGSGSLAHGRLCKVVGAGRPDATSDDWTIDFNAMEQNYGAGGFEWSDKVERAYVEDIQEFFITPTTQDEVRAATSIAKDKAWHFMEVMDEHANKGDWKSIDRYNNAKDWVRVYELLETELWTEYNDSTL